MYNTVITFEFEQLLKKEKLKVIDVRELEEVREGHIKGMIHMPLSEFGKHLDKLDKHKAYYVICRSGARSSQAAKFLAEQGFNVTNVMGGMSVYKGELSYDV